MIPTPQPLLPFGVVAYGVIKGGGNIGAQHAEEIEDDADAGPVVVVTEHPKQEDDAYHDTQQHTTTVGRRVPYLFFLRIAYHFFLMRVSPSRMGSMTCSVRGSLAT